MPRPRLSGLPRAFASAVLTVVLVAAASAGVTVDPQVGTTFVPLEPARLLDTRFGTGLSGPFVKGVPRTFQVTGAGGVPATAAAVTGNLTATAMTAAGFVFLGPTPIANPSSSTLNFPQGDNRANAVTVALSQSGTLSATYSGPASGNTTHLIFDVTGYFILAPIPTPDTTPRHITCGWSSFLPEESSNGWSSGGPGRRLLAGQWAQCGLFLPDGASVTGFAAYGVDLSSTSWLQCELWRGDLIGSGSASLALPPITGVEETPGDVVLEDTTIQNPVIDNETYFYTVSCSLAADPNVRIKAVRVEYLP